MSLVETVNNNMGDALLLVVTVVVVAVVAVSVVPDAIDGVLLNVVKIFRLGIN